MQPVQQPSHKDIGIPSFLIDLRTGMSAHESFYTDPATLSRLLFPAHRQCPIHPCASRTSCQEDPLLFGVQVQHSFSFQHGNIQLPCAVHSHFLIHRQDHFQPRMGYIARIQQSHSISHRNSIVPAQARVLRIQIIPVHGKAQPILRHIDRSARLFYRHHIHMPLQDHRFRFLVSRRSVLYHNHILPFILEIIQSPLFRKID